MGTLTSMSHESIWNDTYSVWLYVCVILKYWKDCQIEEKLGIYSYGILLELLVEVTLRWYQLQCTLDVSLEQTRQNSRTPDVSKSNFVLLAVVKPHFLNWYYGRAYLDILGWPKSSLEFWMPWKNPNKLFRQPKTMVIWLDLFQRLVSEILRNGQSGLKLSA